MREIDVREYIALKVGLLGSAFGRKINQYQVHIFQRRLERFSIPALNKAFEYAEDTFEKLPTPNKMAEIAARFHALQRPSYRYPIVRVSDPGTGAPIEAKKDPVTGEILYRVTDCPEGRAFLEMRKSLTESKKKSRTKTSNSSTEGLAWR
jgi:hypothetical protein